MTTAEFLRWTFFIHFVICYSSSDTIWTPWVLDDSIVNSYTATGLIRTESAHCLGQCIRSCNEDKGCAMIGYSSTATSCDIYMFDVSNQSSLVFQADTAFYMSARCPRQDYTLLKYLNLCIKVHSDNRDWDNARTVCQNEGGDLLKLKVDKSLEDLQAMLTESHYWIGGRQDPGDADSWFWPDGTAMDTNVWKPGEPNTMLEQCTILCVDSMRLNDLTCSAQRPFVCEIV